MSQPLTNQLFEPRVNEKFRVALGAESVDLQLIECKLLASHSWQGKMREPFALLFQGPPQPVLPQRIYSLHNEGTGDLELFLVPVGKDSEGIKYEAVFT